MVIVLSFFVLIIVTYTIPRATQAFFFLQHIGIQDMMAAENKNQFHTVHCKS